MSKQVSEPFYVCSSVPITNAAVFISSVSSLIRRDTLSYQFIWSGVSSTTFYIQTSNNYSPGLPQNAGAILASNNGNWDSIPFTTTPTTNSGTSYTAVVNQAGPAWVRFMAVTTSSGTALLSALISAKSLG